MFLQIPCIVLASLLDATSELVWTLALFMDPFIRLEHDRFLSFCSKLIDLLKLAWTSCWLVASVVIHFIYLFIVHNAGNIGIH